ncbi:nitrate/sulfonate/bicarbonate ABC transporter ATP-binding protein [Cohnella abietis]|uniref:Nitrate/sulfonate/bicarbonate ABC transporter ATP-binding protein n=2 Tax=Cohnella abietis TaxID=2507935 RepID=A0A3T1D7S2_9BACL|nr:nitrate/sulfonate/bicarbonate ABC transporter ATP-binding protein [Cohnella abietis]
MSVPDKQQLGISPQLKPTNAPIVVKMSDVSKAYENGKIAVGDVNLDIRQGEFISFVGPSGCGKSTVFRMIAGLTRPSEGSIEVLGGTSLQARESNLVSFVFQDATLMPWSSVMDNVTLPLKLKGVPAKLRQLEGSKALELVGLQDYAKALPRQLSGGMKMRASIARALVAQPKLLLMDEPFGALDEMTRQTLQEELLTIWQREKDMTVLFVTHNVFEAVYLSTRIAVMTPSPGGISQLVDVPFSYPRQEEFRATADFGDYVRQVSTALHGTDRRAL